MTVPRHRSHLHILHGHPYAPLEKRKLPSTSTPPAFPTHPSPSPILQQTPKNNSGNSTAAKLDKCLDPSCTKPTFDHASTKVFASQSERRPRSKSSRAKSDRMFVKRGDQFRYVREYVRRIFPRSCDLQCWSFVISTLVWVWARVPLLQLSGSCLYQVHVKHIFARISKMWWMLYPEFGQIPKTCVII